MGAFLKGDFDRNTAERAGYMFYEEEKDNFGLFIMKWGIILTCSFITLGCIISIYESVR